MGAIYNCLTLASCTPPPPKFGALVAAARQSESAPLLMSYNYLLTAQTGAAQTRPRSDIKSKLSQVIESSHQGDPAPGAVRYTCQTNEEGRRRGDDIAS